MERVESALAAARIVPVIRGGDSLSTAEKLLDSGLSVIELTATTQGWLDVLSKLRARHPTATLGMGTVVTAEDATAALEAGADFLVSPWPVPAVRDVASDRFLEGGFTPAEVAAASAHGIAKLFPAHVGGIAYLKSLLAVLPGARIMPTGGIKPDQAAQWLAAGAFAVGIGSDLARIPEVVHALP